MDNNEMIASLINSIEDGAMVDATEFYDGVMSSKVADILSARRQEMTNRIFNGDTTDDNQDV
jgi:hypothetical protein